MLHRFEDQPSLRYGSAGENEHENDITDQPGRISAHSAFIFIPDFPIRVTRVIRGLKKVIRRRFGNRRS